MRCQVLKAICRDTQALLLSPGPVVDEVWHALMLLPAEYMGLCTLLLTAVEGDSEAAAAPVAAVFDHRPVVDDEVGRHDRMGVTRAMYKRVFREEAVGVVWPWPSDQPGAGPPAPPVAPVHVKEVPLAASAPRARGVAPRLLQPWSGVVPPEATELRFVDRASGAEVVFKVRRSTLLGKVFSAYAAKTGTRRTAIRFLFDGKSLNDEDTPESLGLEDHDVVLVALQQYGC